MFLCICVYLILFTIPVFANPDPWIGQPIEVNGKSYDPQNPPEITLGEYLTIAVGGFNYQGSDAQEQYLQISFPDLTGSASSVEILSTNLPNSYTKPPNSEVWGGYGSYKVTTSYWFVEGYAAPWKSGKSYYLKVKVKPEKAGNFRIFVKTTALYNGAWFADPTTSGSAKSPEVYSYVSGITSDQQNEYVFYYTVTVKQPAAEDKANIVSFTPPSGEFSPGDTISAQVTVKNTGTTTRSFWVGLSYQKSDGSWLDVPPKQTSTLSPGATQTLTFTYTLPADVPEGYYNARVAVWNGYDSANNLMVEPRFDVRDVQSAFRVVPQVISAEIARLTLDKPNVKPGEAVTATVKILNTGNVGLDYLLIRVSIVKDGSTVVGEKTLESGISLPAGGEKTLSLNIWTVPENAESGTYKVVLKLTDMTAEKVYDSEYAFFDVTALPRLNVQLISPSDGEVVTSLPITFMVRVTSNGEPVEGARVMLTFTDGGTSSSGWLTTDSNGYATYTGFSSLSSGSGVSWYAEAYKDGYQSGVSETWHFRYKKENIPPTATISSISPNPATKDEPVYFSGYGTDPDGTIVAYSWRSSIDGFLSSSDSFSTSSLSPGEHIIYFKVQDDSGAWSDEATMKLVVNPPQELISEPPELDFLHPTSSEFNRFKIGKDEQHIYFIRCKDKDGDLAKIVWFIDDKYYTENSVSGDSAISELKYSFDKEGYHTITAVCYDNAGNNIEGKWYIDVISPLILSVDLYPKEVCLGDSFKIEGKTSQKSYITINDETSSSKTNFWTESDGRFIYRGYVKKVGRNTIKIEAKTGNLKTFKEEEIIVEKCTVRKPQVNIEAPTNYYITVPTNQKIFFKVKCKDDDENLASIQWYINNKFIKGDVISGSEVIRTFSYIFPKEGTYYVKTKCIDTTEKSASVEWKVSAKEGYSGTRPSIKDSLIYLSKSPKIESYTIDEYKVGIPNISQKCIDYKNKINYRSFITLPIEGTAGSGCFGVSRHWLDIYEEGDYVFTLKYNYDAIYEFKKVGTVFNGYVGYKTYGLVVINTYNDNYKNTTVLVLYDKGIGSAAEEALKAGAETAIKIATKKVIEYSAGSLAQHFMAWFLKTVTSEVSKETIKQLAESTGKAVSNSVFVALTFLPDIKDKKENLYDSDTFKFKLHLKPGRYIVDFVPVSGNSISGAQCGMATLSSNMNLVFEEVKIEKLNQQQYKKSKITYESGSIPTYVPESTTIQKSVETPESMQQTQPKETFQPEQTEEKEEKDEKKEQKQEQDLIQSIIEIFSNFFKNILKFF